MLYSINIKNQCELNVFLQFILRFHFSFVIIFLILMAIMSTGSAEIIALASIVIYDLYQVSIHKTESQYEVDSFHVEHILS